MLLNKGFFLLIAAVLLTVSGVYLTARSPESNSGEFQYKAQIAMDSLKQRNEMMAFSRSHLNDLAPAAGTPVEGQPMRVEVETISCCR